MRTMNTTRTMAINVDRSFSAYLVLIILSLAPLHAKPASALSGEAGEDNAIAVCSNATPFLMIDSLLGTPQPGGAWITPEELPHGPLFIPGIHMGGTYCYVVGGDTACLSITVSVPPYAGSDGFLSICGDSLPELPFPNGADTTGHWVNCGPGIHCYVVPGTFPCSNDTAVMTVYSILPPDAGMNNMITVCPDMPPFSMVDSLLGTPDPAGQWDYWGIPVSGIFDPSSGASGTYVYTVPGTSPCVADVSHLTIMVLPSNDPQCLSTGVGGSNVLLNVNSRPNPSNGQFTLSYPVQPEAGMLEVLDMQGRMVYQSRLAAWSQVHRVALGGEAAGMYQCRLRWGARSISTRIIITEP